MYHSRRDNIFASLLAGIGNKTIAYSNLIQVGA